MKTNRRNFLKLSGAAALTASTPAWAVPTNQPEKWDEEYDIVIIGAGGAGLAAGVESVKQGLKAIVIEKMPMIGGSSVLCGGKFALARTPEQKAKGINDDEKRFFDDMMKTGGYQNDPELVKVFIKESRNHYDFVTKELGIKPHEITAAAGMSVPRAHGFKPGEVLSAMRDYFTQRGGKVVLGIKAERLTWDYKNSTISGVKCSQKDKTIYIKANKGVLLASGGFNRNPELLKKYAPPMAKAAVIAGVGTTGDGLLMAQAYGADVLDMAYVKATYGFKLNPRTIGDMAQIYYGGAVMVNKEGKRFVNESLSYKLLGDLALSQPEGKSYMIFDEPMRKAQMGRRAIDKKLFSPIDEGKQLDFLYTGKTIAEAAKKAGLPVETVEETIRNYNKGVEAGNDVEFGRNSLTSGHGKPMKIETGPFYIMPTTAALIGTYCGLKINTKAQVIDVFGDKINNLYAAGEIVGGVHGSAYMTGTAWGKAMSLGRLAARNIAGK